MYFNSALLLPVIVIWWISSEDICIVILSAIVYVVPVLSVPANELEVTLNVIGACISLKSSLVTASFNSILPVPAARIEGPTRVSISVVVIVTPFAIVYTSELFNVLAAMLWLELNECCDNDDKFYLITEYVLKGPYWLINVYVWSRNNVKKILALNFIVSLIYIFKLIV